MALLWEIIISACFFSCVRAVAPVCSPTTIAVVLGTNTTAGTTLATLSCTDTTGGHTVSYTVNTADDGYAYFGMTGSNLVLVNRLDMEYGQRLWSVRVFAIDNDASPNTGTVTISFTTYQSTTTTTTTPAPPGYSWFNNDTNVILFGAFWGLFSLITGTCILLCLRFHRVGTCLPSRCPEWGDLRASCRRQCHCCPLPCDFGQKPDIDDERRAALVAHAQKPEPEQQTTGFVAKKSASGKPPKAKQRSSLASPAKEKIPEEDEDPRQDRRHVVSPVVIGNVNLTDVGFDGMRSPGFNAPMFTTYGGKNDKRRPLKKY